MTKMAKIDTLFMTPFKAQIRENTPGMFPSVSLRPGEHCGSKLTVYLGDSHSVLVLVLIITLFILTLIVQRYIALSHFTEHRITFLRALNEALQAFA